MSDTTDRDTTVISLADRREPEWSLEDCRRLFAPSVKVLPFVKRDQKRPFNATPLKWWDDTPGIDHKLDVKRGRAYATMTIEAIAADKCGSNPLEAIFKSIVDDAVARKIKGGKHSRTLPPAVDGYLWELSKFISRAADKIPLDEPPSGA
jgi:hypothetical protein